jgi:tetratricopeptide (TPR) repeat protein
MELHGQLDSARVATDRRLICLLLLLFLPNRALPQTIPSTTDRISEVKKLYEAGRWSEVIQTVAESPDEAADLELYRGLALAQLQRWGEAKKAFEAGLVRNPRDSRLLVELAGIAYREKQFSRAKRELRRALVIDRRDDYANNFLASMYFLEGNLEAALKYWNRAGKPKLEDLTFDPQPRLNPLLLDRAFAFSRGREWRGDQFLTTQARLKSLGLFPHMLFELEAQADGSFNLRFHGSERNGSGNGKWEGLISLLRGLPYQSVYPEFYNLDRGGLNWRSLVRWDDEKRRVFSEIGAPLGENPGARYRVYFDGRNENWDLRNTIAPSTPSSAHLNLEKALAGVEIQSIVSGRWQWKSGVEYSYRKFRNVAGVPPQTAAFFMNGSAIALRSRVGRSLVRFPERRFTIDSSVTGEFGTFFEGPLSRYGRIEGSLPVDWFPQAKGEDYEMQGNLRGGRTFGKVPFDELFMLGFERDNDLWLRGHPGLRNGEKGNAPLGRNYVLANWEMDKIVYKGAFFAVKVGPFVDSGKIYDPSGNFGSPKWLWDTGIQAKIRLLGSLEFVLGYGKDLRSGNNSFFTTVTR